MLTTEKFENNLKGKSIIVGITYVSSSGEFVDTLQFSGVLDRLEDGMVFISVNYDDMNEFSLPPDEDSFELAPEGIYTMRSTGQVVENPEIMSTWTVELNDEEEWSDDGRYEHRLTYDLTTVRQAKIGITDKEKVLVYWYNQRKGVLGWRDQKEL